MKVNNFSKENGVPLNLHLGCGAKYIPNWINIDFYDDKNIVDTSRGSKPLKCDLLINILELEEHVEENTVENILMVHTLEHFVRWEAMDLLNIFFKILKPGGTLEMEHPDLDQCIYFYLKRKDKVCDTPLGKLNVGFTQFYGNQWDKLDYETHRYVWTKPEMETVLKDIGFEIVEISNNAKYHLRERDMRVVVKK